MVIFKAWIVSNGTGLSAEEAVRIQSLVKKLRWFLLLKDFFCAVTRKWTNNEDNREFHTWRAWGSRARKKTARPERHTLYELKTEKCVKGWAGWTPASEAEMAEFQELVLCPRSDHGQAVVRDVEVVRDWSFCMTGWWALLQRLKPPRLRQETGTNYVYLKK